MDGTGTNHPTRHQKIIIFNEDTTFTKKKTFPYTIQSYQKKIIQDMVRPLIFVVSYRLEFITLNFAFLIFFYYCLLFTLVYLLTIRVCRFGSSITPLYDDNIFIQFNIFPCVLHWHTLVNDATTWRGWARNLTRHVIALMDVFCYINRN